MSFVPLNTTKISQASDKSFYHAGGKRDYPQWAMVNEFDSSYYSGLDVSVYFNDLYVDEAVQLTYSEMEQTKPLYGYADYTYRSVIHGSRIVQGSFLVNFKDAGYIPKMLVYLSNESRGNRLTQAIAEEQLKSVSDPKEGASTEEQRRMTLARQILASSSSWPADRLAMSRDFTLEDVVNYERGSKDGYMEYMDELKKLHWGEEVNNKVLDTVIDNSEVSPKFALLGAAKNIGFDIVLKYGQPEDPVTKAQKPGWGTIEVLHGCHITGYQKTIDDSGRNILEAYNFIAKTVA